ncbi:MAGE domain-containing protein [Citrus sinensis]|uniref:MAGE domain-containing protein n=1 Tax=Citrus sinensis TaxID=2711 RepID=A0ACB8KQ67_CITSI|nr:MAGE domain-containing protein [Citrus sinensis]
MKFSSGFEVSISSKSAGVPSEGYWDATGPPASVRCSVHPQRALPAHVINAAKEKLSNAFGYELRELLRCRPSSATQGRSTQQTGVAEAKSYVLISQLPAEVYKKYVEDENSAHLSGFTFVVISIVHLAGGKIPEGFLFSIMIWFLVLSLHKSYYASVVDILWRHLKRMGLCETDASHPVFGNAKQALETLVQQRYLQKDKVNGPEGNTLFYELAERALDGPVSEKMKEYISERRTMACDPFSDVFSVYTTKRILFSIVSKDVVPVDVDEAE